MSTFENELCIKILKNNRIGKAFDRVEVQELDMGGDHFASRCEFWTLHFKGDIETLDLFVKKFINHEGYGAMLRATKMFEKEAMFFNSFLPDAIKFLSANGGYDGFFDTALPRCYYADPDLVVMNNLAKQGYSTLGQGVKLNLDQTRKFLHLLGRLHGTSYAMVQSLGLDKAIERYPTLEIATLWRTEAGVKMNGPLFGALLDGFRLILKTCPTPGSDEVLDSMHPILKDGVQRLAELHDPSRPSCAVVLNHGDCWGMNIMWTKNGEKDEPEKCLLLDLQTVFFGSPVLDLTSAMYYTVDTQVRRSEWKTLLREYYQVFKKTCECADVQIQFTFEDLLSDYRSRLEYGLIAGAFSIFGMEALSTMDEVDNVAEDLQEYFSSSIIEAVNRNLAAKGDDYSRKLVELWAEFKNVQHSME